MSYEEEGYVLDTLMELQERIRDMPNKDAMVTFMKEVRENNIMLKGIVRYLANEAVNADNENSQDFGRNILANMISTLFESQFINTK